MKPLPPRTSTRIELTGKINDLEIDSQNRSDMLLADIRPVKSPICSCAYLLERDAGVAARIRSLREGMK
jgi:hypothetical protein